VNEFGTKAYSKIVRWFSRFFVAFLFGAFLAILAYLLRRWDDLDIIRVYVYFFFFILYVNIEFRTFRGPDEAAYADFIWVRYLLTYSWWFLIVGSLLEHALTLRTVPTLSIIGIVLSLAGIVLGYSARRAIQGELSPRVDTWANMRIVEKGPYAVIRHPSYAANMLLVIGMPLILSSLVCLVFSAILIVLFLRRLLWEEQVLIERLPEYAEYVQRTDRLIPRVW
jgi:protein-S-isoprenylcysteine O-methyltransferase Ste14